MISMSIPAFSVSNIVKLYLISIKYNRPNGQNFKLLTTSLGWPQGDILFSILFIVYTSALDKVITNRLAILQDVDNICFLDRIICLMMLTMSCVHYLS